MTPLSPVLYRRLQERFGSVLIANEGEAFQACQQTDAMTGRSRVRVISSGEQYRVSCPKCNDTRHRLYIGHRWADFHWLAYCHNENCYANPASREQLYTSVFRTRKTVFAPVAAGSRFTAGAITPRLPEGVTPLAELAHDHPAVEYIVERGLDPAELSRLYRVGYCERADPKFPLVERRLIAPVETAGRLVGWQARFVGERNWKACPVPKYYDMPGMVKRLALYNLDQAKKYPMAVLVEGVTDVWAVGPHAVALLGKSISYHQCWMLLNSFQDRPLVVMLDGDAHKENDAITRDLADRLPAGVMRVTLPGDRDPADFTKDAVAEIIRLEADRQGVRLPVLDGKPLLTDSSNLASAR